MAIIVAMIAFDDEAAKGSSRIALGTALCSFSKTFQGLMRKPGDVVTVKDSVKGGPCFA